MSAPPYVDDYYRLYYDDGTEEPAPKKSETAPAAAGAPVNTPAEAAHFTVSEKHQIEHILRSIAARLAVIEEAVLEEDDFRNGDMCRECREARRTDGTKAVGMVIMAGLFFILFVCK